MYKPIIVKAVNFCKKNQTYIIVLVICQPLKVLKYCILERLSDNPFSRRLFENCPDAVRQAPDRRVDLVDRPTDMDRRGSIDVGVCPRDRSIERPVDLEHARAVHVPRQAAAIALATANRFHRGG